MTAGVVGQSPDQPCVLGIDVSGDVSCNVSGDVSCNVSGDISGDISDDIYGDQE